MQASAAYKAMLQMLWSEVPSIVQLYLYTLLNMRFTKYVGRKFDCFKGVLGINLSPSTVNQMQVRSVVLVIKMQPR